MHLLAVLLTTNTTLINAAERANSSIRKEVIENSRFGAIRQLTLVSFHPERRSGSFVDFLGENIGLSENRPSNVMYHGIMVLYDRRAAQHVADIRDGIFALAFDGREYIENRPNFLVKSFGRLAKNLITLSDAMSDKTRMEAAILPARNFNSAAFEHFLQVCQENAGSPDFQNRVAQALSAVTQLRGPKRRSKYPEKYFKDERDIYYQYGPERHASFETGGNHTSACAIRGLFRMGIPLEQQRHFNVTTGSAKTLISGKYSICHDERVIVKNRTHLNMFSNDFLK